MLEFTALLARMLRREKGDFDFPGNRVRYFWVDLSVRKSVEIRNLCLAI